MRYGRVVTAMASLAQLRPVGRAGAGSGVSGAVYFLLAADVADSSLPPPSVADLLEPPSVVDWSVSVSVSFASEVELVEPSSPSPSVTGHPHKVTDAAAFRIVAMENLIVKSLERS